MRRWCGATGGGSSPPPLGQTVLDAVGDAFERIRAADAILTGKKGVSLRIVGSYSFAVLWLAPRLSRFQDRGPEVKLFLEPSHGPLDQAQADITILHAADPPDRTGWVMLFADRCAAVARAGHPLFRQTPGSPADMLRARLVHVSHGRGPAWGEFSWQHWASALGLPPTGPLAGPTVTAEPLAVDMVLAEEAFAPVGLVNASHLIAGGRLRAAPGSAVATGCRYWMRLRGTEGRAGRLAAGFLSWVQDELAQEPTIAG